MAQRVEQGGDGQRGGDNGDLRSLPCEGAEGVLQGDHAAEVEEDQHPGERTVDQRAVDDEVYVVEPISQDRYAYSDRNGWYKGYVKCEPGSLEPEWRIYDYGGEVRKAAGDNARSNGVGEPLDLLTLHSCGMAQSHENR